MIRRCSLLWILCALRFLCAQHSRMCTHSHTHTSIHIRMCVYVAYAFYRGTHTHTRTHATHPRIKSDVAPQSQCSRVAATDTPPLMLGPCLRHAALPPLSTTPPPSPPDPKLWTPFHIVQFCSNFIRFAKVFFCFMQMSLPNWNLSKFFFFQIINFSRGLELSYKVHMYYIQAPIYMYFIHTYVQVLMICGQLQYQ